MKKQRVEALQLRKMEAQEDPQPGGDDRRKVWH